MKAAVGLSREDKIGLCALIILLGFVLSVFYHYILGAYLDLPYPSNTFLFKPVDRFRDFLTLPRESADLNPYLSSSTSAQYPFTSMLGYVLSLLPQSISLALYVLLVVYGFMISAAVFLHSEAKNKYEAAIRIVIFSLMTYPFLFTIDRGNIEGLLFVFLLVFIYFFTRKHYMASGVMLSLAIAMKLYPAVLLLLFLPERKFKEIIISCISVIAISGASLMSFQGGFWANLQYLLGGSNFSNNFIFGWFLGNTDIVQHGISIFNLMKVIFIETGTINSIDMAGFLSGYLKVMVVASIPLAAYVALVERTLWKRAALLIFAMLLFPHISADYKLIHVFIPLYLFINSDQRSKGDLAYTVMFGLLLIPKDYILLQNVTSEIRANDVSIAVLLNPFIMLAMSSTIVASGLRNWLGQIKPAPVSELQRTLE